MDGLDFNLRMLGEQGEYSRCWGCVGGVPWIKSWR